MKILRETQSICPICNTIISATIFVEDDKVYIKKICPEHGETREVYWGDYQQYKRALNYEYEGEKIRHPDTVKRNGCPFDCGLCEEHKSNTILAIIDVTNRCNLRCPICFAHAGASGYLYEPSKKLIREMMIHTISKNPNTPPGIQFSGGEPTVREDLPELVEMAKELGFIHLEVNTNGLKMAESVDYCRSLLYAGINTVYLQFDGLKSETYMETRGTDLLSIKKKAVQNLREAGCRSIVLVPVLIKGVNDDQVGDIIRYAVENRDIVRGVNFQPISITGRVDLGKRLEMRITIPDLMVLAEEQTNGLVLVDNWYPVSASVPISRFIGRQLDEETLCFTVHPHCGMATYLVMDGDSIAPLSKYVNAEDFIERVESLGKNASMEVVDDVIDGILKDYLVPLMEKGNYETLSDLHHNVLMIGSMHFMDPYNFDVERVKRCGIHYISPEMRLIPFCAMNNLYREKIERRFSTLL